MSLEPLSAIRSLRPRTSALAASIFAVAATYLGSPSPGLLILATVCIFAVTGGGFAYNDYRDYDIDVFLKRHRPIALGQVSRKSGLILACVLWSLAALAAPLLGLVPASIIFAAILLLALYDRLKNLFGVLGNLATAFLSLLLILLAGHVASATVPHLTCAGLILPFIVAREILMDVSDAGADARHGRTTLPVLLGPRKSLLVVAALALFGGLYASAISSSTAWTVGILTAYSPLLVSPLVVYLRPSALRLLIHASWGSLAIGGVLITMYLAGR